MSKDDDDIILLKKEVSEIKKAYHIKKIGIFEENFCFDDNINFFVEFEKKSTLKLFNLIEILQELLHKKVNLLTSTSLNNIKNEKLKTKIKKSINYF